MIKHRLLYGGDNSSEGKIMLERRKKQPIGEITNGFLKINSDGWRNG
jgi:hypothetical protein